MRDKKKEKQKTCFLKDFEVREIASDAKKEMVEMVMHERVKDSHQFRVMCEKGLRIAANFSRKRPMMSFLSNTPRRCG